MSEKMSAPPKLSACEYYRLLHLEQDDLEFLQLVRQLRGHDDRFQEEDLASLMSVYNYYCRRVENSQMRTVSGWWLQNETGQAKSLNKLSRDELYRTLLAKAMDWYDKHDFLSEVRDQLDERMCDAGVFVFQHQHQRYFRYVGFANNIKEKCFMLLNNAFNGHMEANEELYFATLMVMTDATEWDFYFISTQDADSSVTGHHENLNILLNDTILKHDSIWPYGLNLAVVANSSQEMVEMLLSAKRHRYPSQRVIGSITGSLSSLDLTPRK